MDPLSNDRQPESTYDRKTLVMAALIFVGFCLLIYFLPVVMTALGGGGVGAQIAAVAFILLLPFIGFWLRGRMKNRS